MTQRQPRFNRSLRCEPLEPRRMLAGDVTVRVNNAGHLLITGDAQSNAIQVEAGLLPGQYTITGLPDDQNVGTTVNGGGSVTVSGVTGDIRALLNAGNDWLNVGQNAPIGIVGSLKIDSGAGDDQINVNNATIGGELIGLTGDGALDGFQVSDTTVTGDVSIVAGAASAQNSYFLTNVVVTTGNVTIRGGDGIDDIHVVGGQLAHGLTVTAGNGLVSSIGILSDIGGDLLVRGGDGPDNISVTGNVGGSVTMRLGAGDDTANIGDNGTTTIAGPTLITGNLGTKSVIFSDTTLNSDLKIALGGGVDVIGFQSNTVLNGNVSITTSGGDDQLYILQSHVVGTLDINLGTGADYMLSQDSAFDSAVSILFGAGDDTLELQNSAFQGPVTFDGGKGFDTIIDDGGNSFDITPTIVRFEA
jgi:hypothetical protein